MRVGHTDEPLLTSQQEQLGVTSHMEALASFICRCNTPITIAIQGDWGTGKTSMMNLVRNRLTEEGITTVWFNTWQFSQFAMQDDVPVVLLMELLNAVGFDREQLKSMAVGLLRRLAVLGAGVVAGAEGSAAVDRATAADPMALVTQIKELKQKLEKAVSDTIAKSRTDRMVIFVDDLDRMAPEKAVELLEVVKNFLDIKGCIFVLAVDYGVVSRGVRKKYGEDMDELKGRSFFDKIIQLPFNLPVGQYTIPQYIQSLLSPREEDLTHFVKLAKHSVGTNPRTLKRMANTLDLLDIVAKNKGADSEKQPEFKRMLFGVLCLQMAYEPVYNQILSEKLGATFFEWDKETKAQSFAQSLSRCPGKEEDVRQRFDNFLQALEESLPAQRADDSEEKSKTDANLFEVVLHFSGITASGGSEVPVPTEAQGKGFDPVLLASLPGMMKELQQAYASFFSLVRAVPEISGGSGENICLPVTLDETVHLVLNVNQDGLGMSFYTEEYVQVKRDFHHRIARLCPQYTAKFVYNGRSYTFMNAHTTPWSGEAAANGKSDVSSSRITQARRVFGECVAAVLPVLETYYASRFPVLVQLENLRERLCERLAPLFPPEQGWEYVSENQYIVKEHPFLRLRKSHWGKGYGLDVLAKMPNMHCLYVGMNGPYCAQWNTAANRLAAYQAWRQTEPAMADEKVGHGEWSVMWHYLPDAMADWCSGNLDDEAFAYALTPDQENAVLAFLETEFKRFKKIETALDAVACG